MPSANLVVMGKTGAGKSTLINAVLGEDAAPTGSGSAVTKEVHTYSRMMDLPLPAPKGQGASGSYRMVRRNVNMYDTVGLEIDRAVTQKTLRDIRAILDNAKTAGDEQDITLVWFCFSASSSRFEPYEAELIQYLSVEYEIPFVIVITQCLSEEKGELERQIENDLPELSISRVLAKDYKLRGGTIPAFGIEELLSSSVADYNKKKVHILEAKLKKLWQQQDVRDARAREKKKEGRLIVEAYAKKATKAARVPLAGIPFVHRNCAKMIGELNELFGIKHSKGYSSEVIASSLLGTAATPFMAVPGLSMVVAGTYIEAVGKTYLKAISSVTPGVASSADVMRICQEIAKRKSKEED